MSKKIQNATILALLTVFSIVGFAQSYPTGILSNNGYCDPGQYYADKSFSSIPWNYIFVSGGNTNCNRYSAKYFYFTRIAYFKASDNSRSNPVWEWNHPDFYECAEYMGYAGVYSWAQDEEGWAMDPAELEIGTEYIVRYELASSSNYNRVYASSWFDRNGDMTFDRFDIGYPNPRSGFDSNPADGEFVALRYIYYFRALSYTDNYWREVNTGWNCRDYTYQYQYYGQYNFNYCYSGSYRYNFVNTAVEYQFEVGKDTPAKNDFGGAPVHRHSLNDNRTNYNGSFGNRSYPYLEPCQIPFYDYGYGYAGMYWDRTQTIDVDIVVGGFEAQPYPGDGDILLASEAYNGDASRVPKKGGDAIAFDKPYVVFTDVPPSGLKLKYQIAGPLPNQTPVYTASNDGSSELIDIELSDLEYFQITNADNELEDRYRWTADESPVASLTDSRYASDENGVPFGDGSFYAFTSGEFAVSISVVDANGNPSEEGLPVTSYLFNIQTDYDLAVTNITSPLTNADPFYKKYRIGQRLNVIFNIKNIGFEEVQQFTYSARFYDENGTLVNESGPSTWKYTDRNSVPMASGETIEVALDGPAFNEPGIYDVVFEVSDLDGQDRDQSQANDFIPRPTSGSQRSNYVFSSAYTVEVAYAVDLVGDAIEHPTLEPEFDVDVIVEGREFRPIVRFANLGIDDDFNCTVVAEVYDDNNTKVAETAGILEDVPAGRFNKATIELDPVVIDDPGRYTIEATISSDFSNKENPAVIDELNTITGEFDVEPGFEGVFTIGTMNETGEPDDKNFETLTEAIQALYFYGISDDLVLEFTDAEYNIGQPIDLRSKMIGLGMQEDGSINELTFRAAPNRSLIRGGVQLNFNNPQGIGFWTGQYFENIVADNAPVNVEANPDFFDFSGYISFDGGDLKALQVNMDTDEGFAAPFFLDFGTHHVDINGVIINNEDASMNMNYVSAPLKRGSDVSDLEFALDEENELDGNLNVTARYTYSAGILNRSRLYRDPEGNPNPLGLFLDTIPNSDNNFTNNDISGFGYGIISLGMGGLFAQTNLDKGIETSQWYNFNNANNTYSGNVIYNVGRAGIAIGNEQNSEISGNMIYDVNPDDMDTDDTGMYDHAGIMVGGLAYGVTDNNVKLKGYSAKNITVDGNRVLGVNSSTEANGIKVEQNFIYYGDFNSPTPTLGINIPDGDENVRITNNIVKGLNATDNDAHRFGIRLTTERGNVGFDINNFISLNGFEEGYRTRNDWIVNNTVYVTDNASGVMPSDNMAATAGIVIQQGEGTRAYNNVVIMDDSNISDAAEYATALFVQGPLPKDNGPMVDYNAFQVEAGTALVRYIEMNEETNAVEYAFDRNDFETLEQWRIYSGSDLNSIEYDAKMDYDITDMDIAIKTENGQLPLGSKLNNRGYKVSWLGNDISGTNRGASGERFDIGAHEFKGRLYLDDIESIRFDEPAAYRASDVDPNSGNDFTGSEHVMTSLPVAVNATVRNDGSVIQDALMTLEVAVESSTNQGEYELVTDLGNLSTEVTESIAATEEAAFDFGNFDPMSYSDYASMDINYVVPDRYKGMEANVTPIYRLTMTTGSDENNGNNQVVKYARFYIVRSTEGMVLNTEFNQSSFSDASDDIAGGAMNTNAIKQAFGAAGFKLDPENGDYDYDVFDRNGWEKFSINFTDYNTMFWVDGGDDNQDGLTRLQEDDIRSFIGGGTNTNKANLVIASQGLVRSLETSKAQELLRAVPGNQPGTNMGANPLGDGASYDGFTVTGEGISEDRVFTIANPNYTPDGRPNLDPKPAAVVAYNKNQQGIAKDAFYYDEYNSQEVLSKTMGIALATTNYNLVYLGLEWRHFQNVNNAMKGILDYIENNRFTNPNNLSSVVTKFNATQQSKAVSLDWTTENEEGIVGFSLERSQDENFIGSEIASFAAQGVSSTDNVYSYIDDAVEYGQTYNYRVRMMDSEGSSDYSEVRSVTILGGNGTNLNITMVNTGEVLNLNGNVDGVNLTYTVYDMAGNQLFTRTTTDQSLSIDINTYLSGAYNLVIESNDANIVKPFRLVK